MTAALFVTQERSASPCNRPPKNRRQLMLTPVLMVLGSSHLVPCKNQGWFDPTLAPWAGGLGFTEPAPDRTVSGNERMVVGHWGAR